MRETAAAQQKQDAFKCAFKDWIWQYPDRRESLTAMSKERQKRLLREQIWEIEDGIRKVKANRSERFSIKQPENRWKRG